MRHSLFIFSAVLALAISAGIALVPAAHAQLVCPAGCIEGDVDNVKGCVYSDNTTKFCDSPTGTAADLTTKANANAQSAQGNSSANTPLNFAGSSAINDAIAYMFSLLMTLFAWLLGVAMVVLDGTVYYTVVTMGNYINNLSAIGVAWRIFRDIGNIALIFGFLAIGITTILDVNWYGGRFKMLPMLLVAAVFLNFSLFMTEAVIDGGNLFATQFYTQINGGIPAGSKFQSKDVVHETISNKIMSQLGLQTLYGKALTDSGLFQAGNTTLIGLLGILLFIVAAFVMFSLSFILIARFVYLIYLIITAPLGFAGLAIPQLEGIANKWWKDLFDQTLTAPILLLLLYIALAVITDVNFISGFGAAPDYAGFIPDSNTHFNLTGFVSMLLTFLVAMGLLLLVTIQAKKLSAFGGEWAMKTAGKISFGATAWAGRTSGGWLARKGANFARSTAIGRVPLVGTGLVRGLDKVAGASFDIRGTSALKTFGGIDAGKAQKGGYSADLKSRIESRTKYAADLKGRELTEDEQVDQKVAQDAIKATEKRLAEAQVRQRQMAAAGQDTRYVDEEIAAEKEILSGYKTKLEKIESVTDKGAQLKYAKALNLGLDEKGFFNKYLNLAANTEAAKKIRKEAKKSSDEKTLDALKKAVKNAEKEEGGGKKEKEEEEAKAPPEEKKTKEAH